MTFALSACGKDELPLSPDYGIADQARIYGVCYNLYERSYTGVTYDPAVEAQLLKNLGVTSLRNWMHITQLLNSPTTVNRAKCDEMHALIAEFQKQGIMVIGMTHTNFNNGSHISGKVKRDTKEGSYYIEWLEDYYTSMKTLVAEFPEVTLWEIDNEVNNADFMKDINGNQAYTINQMAEIATDIFYYASRGIHEANPNAKSVMGGLVGFQSGKIKTFMEMLYQNIFSGEYGYFYGKEDKSKASKNPDDYFEIACWHPYMTSSFSSAAFKKLNDDIYQVILDNEKKHKKVIFSEVGFTNNTFTEELTAKYVEEMYTTVKEGMPYVESVCYFKTYDYADPSTYWMGTISRYGLFYDPNPQRSYTQALGNDTTTRLTPGAPKLSAYAFQKVAGGKGSLELVATKLT